MARQSHRSLINNLIHLALFFILLGFSSFMSFWNSLAPECQTLLIVLISALFVSGAALIVVWIRYRKHQREQAWKRAMAAWDQSQREGRASRDASARSLSPGHLEQFSAQLFKQMGYRVVHTGRSGDHGVDVHLVNPNGQVELVQCKQWSKPVGEPEVRDLAGAMLHEKAVRGFIIAPGGFSESARRWNQSKRIVLAGERVTNRLVESAYGSA